MFLRKKTDVDKVYHPSPSVDLKLLTVAVNKMFDKDSWRTSFSICSLEKILETFEMKPTRSDLMKRLNLLHCVGRDKMDKETYKFCVDAVREVIKTSIIVKKENHEHPQFTPSDFTW